MLTTSLAFLPMTKEDVADVLRVTTRTIEKWVENKEMPAPAAIGGRVFWHPDVFYRWLETRLLTPEPGSCRVLPAESSPKRRPAVSAEMEHLRGSTGRRVAAIEARVSHTTV